MHAVLSRSQRATSTSIRTFAIASSNALHLVAHLVKSNDKMTHVCRQPLRQFKENKGVREVCVVGVAVAALTALATKDARCEPIEQEDKQDGDSTCNLWDGNTKSDNMPIYFDTEYEAKKLLGCGAFGLVMQCVHKQTGRIAAVKMVQDLEGSQEEVKREKQALECFKRAGGHTSIVGYEGSYYHNDFHYIVLEYVPGMSLHSYMDKHHLLDTTLSLQLVSQLASALQFMHKAGIVHCDLKPENVMVLVTRDNKRHSDPHKEKITLKLIDFGSVSRNPQLALKDKSCTVSLSGTRCYWSPEALEYQTMTPAMDMWALGCILYILISGHHPFDLTGSSSEDTILQRVKKSPNALSFISPVWNHVSIETKELIGGLLEKDPNCRLSADQVLQHSAIIAATQDDLIVKELR
ncbi:unnamed protein product [Peronospora belbahrii]|uniref:Protein kinase domain-containing protein n=1 Tax=Peronospora belbahrii TaxID=622444 RepID=A0AAU9LDL9_9STRA|nr:unnamed protein product [Peronospora belbahrii]